MLRKSFACPVSVQQILKILNRSVSVIGLYVIPFESTGLKISRFKYLFLRVLEHLRTDVPFVTTRLEIFHCAHHPVIPKSNLYFISVLP